VLKALRERAEAMLSNFVTVSKTHVTSSGMSPVNLLDTPAVHVSVTVTEIGKAVCIRKASRAELDDFAASSSSSPVPLNTSTSNGGFSPLCALWRLSCCISRRLVAVRVWVHV